MIFFSLQYINVPTVLKSDYVGKLFVLQECQRIFEDCFLKAKFEVTADSITYTRNVSFHFSEAYCGFEQSPEGHCGKDN